VPWLANAVDMSWEKYFQDGAGYVSLAVFYKDIDQFLINLPQVEDFTGFPFDDTAGQPGTFQGYVTRPENGDGGDISGVEVSVSINGDLFSDAIRNFGIVANYSYTDSSIEPLPGIEIPIPGLSRDVANVTVYYENDSFSARVSNRYRSDFLGEVSGFGGGREFRTIEGESILDAQLSYNFSGSLEGLTLLAQGFNLTDEPLRTFDPGSTGTNRIIDYQRYGRSYMVGASYRFE
jgi:iron complex outermembrane receptor protein